MIAAEAKQMAIDARIKAVEDIIKGATEQGLFETRTEKLTAEQKQYLAENGFQVREIEQKGGSTWNINWE